MKVSELGISDLSPNLSISDDPISASAPSKSPRSPNNVTPPSSTSNESSNKKTSIPDIGKDAQTITIDKALTKQAQTDIAKRQNTRSRNLFICYLCICLFWGFVNPLAGVIFSELQLQLNVSDIVVTQLFLSRAITYCVGAIVIAYIIDKFLSTHRCVAFDFILAAASVSSISLINEIPIQHLLWIIIGFTHGLTEVALPVFAFRTFTEGAKTAWFVLLTSYGVAKTLIPLMVQLSLTLFDSFLYAMLAMAAVAACAAILLSILRTPQHDKLRTMNKQIARTGSHRSAESILLELEQHRLMRNILIVLFAVVLVLFLMIQNGLIIFVTVYVVEYLDAPAVIGRYLISTYYAAQLLYRFIIAFCLSDYLKTVMHSTNYLFGVLIAGYAIEVVLFMIWIFFTILADDMNVNITIAILFAVFAGTGFLSSPTYPTVYELCETVYPIDGYVSCVFTMAKGVGDFLVCLIMAQIIEYLHIGFQPIPIAIAAVCEIILIVIIRVIYNKYKSYESVILTSDKREEKADKAVVN